jgi:predicted RNA polymerase sigma factor
MKGYHLLPSVRGDLLARLLRRQEAAAEFERAAGMTCNAREQELFGGAHGRARSLRAAAR